MSDRQQAALSRVKYYMWWSGGAGLVPVPLVDLAAVSGVQLKMLAEICKIYEVPFKESRGKAAVGALVGFVLPHAAAYGLLGSLLKAIPIVGSLAGAPAMGLFCAAYSWALGNVFIQHFESGGTFLDFDAEKVKEHFRAQFDEGMSMSKAATKKTEVKAEAKASA